MIFFNNKKVNKFGGNNRIYQGDWLIYQTYTGDISEPIEPSIEYTPIQYISNISGTTKNDVQQIYFDFGVYINERTKFQVCFETLYASGGLFIGDTSSAFDDSNDYRFFNFLNTSFYFDVYNNKRISINISKFEKNEFGQYEVECGTHYMKSLVNGYTSGKEEAYTFNGGKLTLWGGDANNEESSLSNVDGNKVYWLKIYDGDELVRDLIPVIDKDGIGCFYDKVNGNFYYKEGEGEVFLGEAI